MNFQFSLTIIIHTIITNLIRTDDTHFPCRTTWSNCEIITITGKNIFRQHSYSVLRNWEFHYVTVNQMANFETNLGISRRILWECGEVHCNFIIALSCCFEMSAFTMQEKAIPSFL